MRRDGHPQGSAPTRRTGSVSDASVLRALCTASELPLAHLYLDHAGADVSRVANLIVIDEPETWIVNGTSIRIVRIVNLEN